MQLSTFFPVQNIWTNMWLWLFSFWHLVESMLDACMRIDISGLQVFSEVIDNVTKKTFQNINVL